MIDLTAIAAAGPILLGVGAGLAGRRMLRRLDERRDRRPVQRTRTTVRRRVHAGAVR